MIERIVGQCWQCGQHGIFHCGCCATCFADLPRAPPRNLRPLRAPDYCHTWLAAMYYQPPLDYWLHQFKFHGQYRLALHFAPLLCAQVLAYHKAQKRRLPSLLVPVPMSNRRWQRRGYNQAAVLVKAISPLLGIPWANALHVNDASASLTQHQLGARERSLAMQGRFTFDCQQVQGRLQGHVALVDDIITTGSTLNGGAMALLEGGADEVSGWAFAYTPAEHQEGSNLG